MPLEELTAPQPKQCYPGPTGVAYTAISVVGSESHWGWSDLHFLPFDDPDFAQGYLSAAARAIVSMAGSFMYCACAFAQVTNSWANASRDTV